MVVRVVAMPDYLDLSDFDEVFRTILSTVQATARASRNDGCGTYFTPGEIRSGIHRAKRVLISIEHSQRSWRTTTTGAQAMS